VIAFERSKYICVRTDRDGRKAIFNQHASCIHAVASSHLNARGMMLIVWETRVTLKPDKPLNRWCWTACAINARTCPSIMPSRAVGVHNDVRVDVRAIDKRNCYAVVGVRHASHGYGLQACDASGICGFKKRGIETASAKRPGAHGR